MLSQRVIGLFGWDVSAPRYSWRRASIGLTLAGAAGRDERCKIPADDGREDYQPEHDRVGGADGIKQVFRNRPRSNAMPEPAATPMITGFNPSTRIMRMTPGPAAPRAIRMPISLVREDTE